MTNMHLDTRNRRRPTYRFLLGGCGMRRINENETPAVSGAGLAGTVLGGVAGRMVGQIWGAKVGAAVGAVVGAPFMASYVRSSQRQRIFIEIRR